MTSSKASNKTNQKGRKTKIAETNSPTVKLVAVCIRSLAISFLSALLIILIASAIIIKLPDPCAAIPPVALSVLYFVAILCGYLSKKSTKNNAVSTGITAGLLLVTFVLITSAVIPSQSTASVNRYVIALLLLPSTVIGALIGNVKLIKKRHHRRSKRK